MEIRTYKEYKITQIRFCTKRITHYTFSHMKKCLKKNYDDLVWLFFIFYFEFQMLVFGVHWVQKSDFNIYLNDNIYGWCLVYNDIGPI